MEALDQIKDVAGWGVNPYLIVLVFCMSFGNVLKRAQCFSNAKIPAVLGLAGAIIFPLLSWSLDKDYLARAIPHNLFLGAIIGWGSVGAHKFFTTTFPKLAWMIPKSEDTIIINKSDVKPPPEDV